MKEKRKVSGDDVLRPKMPKAPADRPVQEGWTDRSRDLRSPKLGTPPHFKRAYGKGK
jgi:hypothetical protein